MISESLSGCLELFILWRHQWALNEFLSETLIGFLYPYLYFHSVAYLDLNCGVTVHSYLTKRWELSSTSLTSSGSSGLVGHTQSCFIAMMRMLELLLTFLVPSSNVNTHTYVCEFAWFSKHYLIKALLIVPIKHDIPVLILKSGGTLSSVIAKWRATDHRSWHRKRHFFKYCINRKLGLWKPTPADPQTIWSNTHSFFPSSEISRLFIHSIAFTAVKTLLCNYCYSL